MMSFPPNPLIQLLPDVPIITSSPAVPLVHKGTIGWRRILVAIWRAPVPADVEAYRSCQSPDVRGSTRQGSVTAACLRVHRRDECRPGSRSCGGGLRSERLLRCLGMQQHE